MRQIKRRRLRAVGGAVSREGSGRRKPPAPPQLLMAPLWGELPLAALFERHPAFFAVPAAPPLSRPLADP